MRLAPVVRTAGRKKDRKVFALKAGGTQSFSADGRLPWSTYEFSILGNLRRRNFRRSGSDATGWVRLSPKRWSTQASRRASRSETDLPTATATTDVAEDNATRAALKGKTLRRTQDERSRFFAHGGFIGPHGRARTIGYRETARCPG